MDPFDIANPLHPLSPLNPASPISPMNPLNPGSPLYDWSNRGGGGPVSVWKLVGVMLGVMAAILAVAGLLAWLMLRSMRRMEERADLELRNDLLRAGITGLPRPSPPPRLPRP